MKEIKIKENEENLKNVIQIFQNEKQEFENILKMKNKEKKENFDYSKKINKKLNFVINELFNIQNLDLIEKINNIK